jgi:hypothetical protein
MSVEEQYHQIYLSDSWRSNAGWGMAADHGSTTSSSVQQIRQRPLMDTLTLEFRDKTCSKKGARSALPIAVRAYSKNTVLMTDLLSIRTKKRHPGRWSAKLKDTNQPQEDRQKTQSWCARHPSAQKISASQSITIRQQLPLQAS